MNKDQKLLELVQSGKHFCILPWIHFHSWPNGKVFPCCMADSSIQFSSTTEPTVLEMMNSSEFKKLRNNMLKDLPSAACQRCYDVEKHGTWSLRKSHNMVRGESNLDAVKATKKDGSLKEFQLKYMDLRFSNICNMKCRSCGPECSSLHAQEYAEKKWTKEHLKIYFNMDKIVVNANEDGSFMEKLKPHLADVEEVYFAGGESLITPEHYELLDHWIKLEKTDIDITYTTNFSVFKFKNKNVLNYWHQFNSVKIYASLDANYGVAEYLRKGTVWKDIEDNIAMIKSKVPHVIFCLTPTISIWNVHNFPDLYNDWVSKGFIDYNTEVRLNLLTNPWWANVNILPPFYKLKIAEKYRKFKGNENLPRSTRNAFATVLNALEADKSEKNISSNPNGLKEFFDDNFQTDKIRNEKLFDVIPELKEVFEWTQLNLSK